MHLKNNIKDYSLFIGLVAAQVVLVVIGLTLIGSSNNKTVLTSYTAPTKEITSGTIGEGTASPQVTGTSTERELVVSINIGTLEELDLLPGIGEKTAQAIIDYRNKNGEFKNLENLKDVSGIGDQTFENIKPFISL